MKKDWIYVLLGAGAVAAGVAGYLLFKKQSKEVPVKEDCQDSREDTFPSHTSDRENQNDRREILRQRSAAQVAPATILEPEKRPIVTEDTTSGDTESPIGNVPPPEPTTLALNVMSSIDSTIEEEASEISVKSESEKPGKADGHTDDTQGLQIPAD